jgi:hypothetical protein
VGNPTLVLVLGVVAIILGAAGAIVGRYGPARPAIMLTGAAAAVAGLGLVVASGKL